MTKRTVRVEIPYRKPDKMMLLGETIKNKHEELAELSPLLPVNKMDVFTTKLGQAGSLRNESIALRAQSESKMEEAKVNMGIAPGQSKDTPDTMYNLMLKVRDVLLLTYQGNEEKLSEWGFDVIVS